MRYNKPALITGLALAALVAASRAQQSDIVIKLTGGQKKTIALPDFRGAGAAAQYADLFNRTVFEDVQRSGLLAMAAKSFYPLNPPQQEPDLRPTPAPGAPRRGEQPQAPNCNGRCLSDWAGAPTSANYLGFGYAAENAGQFVAFGHFYNTGIADPNAAKVFRKLYTGALSEDGARKTAHEYAADILQQFGVPSLAGTKVYFVSDRSGRGTKEIWVMDFDGANQRQLTQFKSISFTPAISADGLRLAFTTFAKGQPQIMMYSTETGRFIPFFNPPAPTNATPSFTPDSQQVLFASSIGGFLQIYVSDLSGANARRLSNSRAIEVEPKVNPKNPSEMLFVSGRGGLQQIYKMNLDGTDVVRLTNGEGEASNPSWHPDGQHIAFAWTRGYAPGNWNVFLMDVASRETVQLTHGEGKNENPTWAPDGRHLVFSSNRTGRSQIYSMLADGTSVTPLTRDGSNWMPVWSK
ncbi:MAG: PD40 domain-containing protein [Acidobacteria bacterium]|nr:PD40 domain-containing protein [Acidobacteriota bacterium]